MVILAREWRDYGTKGLAGSDLGQTMKSQFFKSILSEVGSHGRFLRRRVA